MQYNDLKLLLYSDTGIVLGNTRINIAQKLLSKCLSFIYLLKQKLKRWLLNKTKEKTCNTNYSVLIINLSNYNLSNQEKQQFKLSLDYCFVDKNKDV